MKLGVLFSGGKDSTLAAYLASKENSLACLISVFSKNPYSYMFHTPSIECTRKQAEVMGIPLIEQITEGKKEEELTDLEKAIAKAKKEYSIKGLVTGAVKSVYQSSRIQKICEKLGLVVVNPLWQKDELELLDELTNNNFEVAVTGVTAYPLNDKWLGRKIDRQFIEDVRELNEKYKINPAGEGGEFETLVLNCPLFSRGLKVKERKISGEKNAFRMDVVLE